MASTRVSLIGELYGCNKALFEGLVQAHGVDLQVTRSPSPEAMRRQLTSWKFDVCEMAFGAYLIARAQGADVTAIPVFPRRAFFHTNFMCRADARIDGPQTLANTRIGVPEYIQSATLWARGALERDFGMDPRSVEWYVERAGANSTGEVLGFHPPGTLRVQQTPGGKSLVAMLADGELDVALIGANLASQASRPLRPLFADTIAEGKRFCQAHGYVPANHIYMVSGRLARSQPEVVTSLYRGFLESQRHAQATLRSDESAAVLFGSEALSSCCQSLATDPFAYGVEANRAMLQDVVHLCVEQGLISEAPTLEQMFFPVSTS